MNNIQQRIAKAIYEAVDIAQSEVRELADKVQSMGDPDGLFDEFLNGLAADIQAIADQLETMCDEEEIFEELDDIAAQDND